MAWIIESNSGYFYYTNSKDILGATRFFEENVDGVKTVKQMTLDEITPLEQFAPIYYVVGKDAGNINWKGLISARDAADIINNLLVDWELSVVTKTDYIFLQVQ